MGIYLSTAAALALGLLVPRALSQAGTAQPQVADLPDSSDWRELVELVCIDCHGGRSPAAGVDLAAALNAPELHQDVWDRAYLAVHGRYMPPATGSLPMGLDSEERAEWIGGLGPLLGADPLDPGEFTIRRLTRSQISLVLWDLLGVQVPVERFLPRDASGYGFDTTGDTLFVSPLYFEIWFELVDAALTQVRENPGAQEALFDPKLPAQQQLTDFVGRAFRRSATETEVAARIEIIEAEADAGASPVDAYLEGIRATLLSPSFLFRTEVGLDRAEPHSPLDGHSLAARLSLTLWGTIPDPGLTALASSGDLLGPDVLAAEVERMLADPKSEWLAKDFGMQWLGANELVDVTPDVRRFRAFNEALRLAMEREALAFLNDLIGNDRSVLECLDAEHAFLNGRLAKHYGIEGVKGPKIRRVAVDDPRRGGVLGLGAVLTVTSEPLRTSPVKRGQWVLDRLLRSPSPPPPPGAGTLPEDDRQEDKLSFRERLEQHRAEPTCASCHARMDPLGFALEELDGIGRIRVPGEGEPPIDVGATLDDGTEIRGVQGLKNALRSDPDRFVRAFAEHLFVYAIGRPPGPQDHRALDEITRLARENGYRFSNLIQGLVRTPAFRRIRSAQVESSSSDSQAAGSPEGQGQQPR